MMIFTVDVLTFQRTGAAHTVLAPYWSKQLGKDKMFGENFHAAQYFDTSVLRTDPLENLAELRIFLKLIDRTI